MWAKQSEGKVKVKDLSDSNLYSVTMMLFQYKRDKDVILKTWLTSELLLFTAAASVFTENQNVVSWSILDPYETCKMLGKKKMRTNTQTMTNTCICCPTQKCRHTHPHTPQPSSWGLFVQSIPLWRLPSTLKNPPPTPSSRASCAPPACIPRARRRGSVCFITFVLILQSVSNSGRKCWALSLLLYSVNVLLKCRETRRSSTERRRHHHLCCIDRTTPTALTLNWLWKRQLALDDRYKPRFHYLGSHNSIPESPARQAASLMRSQAWNWIFTNELYPISGSQTIQSKTECNTAEKVRKYGQ